jgi:lysophospholipase L1-like esterase
MRKTLGKVLLILSSCGLALLIVEIAVRVLDLPPQPLAPIPITDFRLSTNPVIGYEFRPGHRPSDRPYRESNRGFAINSAGFRDYEYTETKPAKTYRIVVLGDSTTAGAGVRDVGNTYTKQLEKRLNTNNSTGMRYEVLNMGVTGYHTMQEIETLRVKGLKYNPDVVLVTFCMNDFDLHSDGGVHRRLLEQTRLSTRSTVGDLYNGLLNRSRLAFIIHHRLKLSQRVHDDSYIENILKKQTTVRAGFALLSELQQRHGFSTLVVILPAFKNPFSEYKHGSIHKRVFQAAEGLPSISIIDLLHSFARLDNNAGKFSYDGLHMNEYGHNAMAEILLPVVKARASDSLRTKSLKEIAEQDFAADAGKSRGQ